MLLFQISKPRLTFGLLFHVKVAATVPLDCLKHIEPK